MKKVLMLILALLLTSSLLTACSGNSNGSGESVQENDRSGGVTAAEGAYIIADYYNEDGTFSELGLALEEVNSEKTMVLRDGDIFIVSDRQYTVTAESLTLSFYTQSSFADVIQWWTDYVRIWSEDGIISEVK